MANLQHAVFSLWKISDNVVTLSHSFTKLSFNLGLPSLFSSKRRDCRLFRSSIVIGVGFDRSLPLRLILSHKFHHRKTMIFFPYRANKICSHVKVRHLGVALEDPDRIFDEVGIASISWYRSHLGSFPQEESTCTWAMLRDRCQVRKLEPM